MKTIATSNIYVFNDFSLDAIHYTVHKSWLTVIDEGRIALHQEHRELLEEMGNGYCLLLSSLPGQGAAQLPQLPLCHLVPSPEALQIQRGEDNSLPPVELYSLPHFPGVCLLGCVSWA